MINRTKYLTTLALFLAFSVAASQADAALRTRRTAKAAPIWEGVIASEADGDTIFIQRSSGTPIKCRLHYADAPEIAHSPKETDQPGGREALDWVKKNWEGKHVTATQHGVSYGRPIVDVVETSTGKNLALDLVQLGLAEVDPRFHPPQAFKDAQNAALEKRLGVFKDTKTPVAPWDWRKNARDAK